MSRARDTGNTAGISEQITETFFGKRSAAFTGNEREVATWTCSERFGEYGQDRESDDGVGLLGLERSNAFTDMLPAQANSVAPAQSGIEQNVKPHSLPRADWPAFFVGGDVLFGPGNEPVTLRARRVSDADGWIDFYQAGLERPPEYAAQGV